MVLSVLVVDDEKVFRDFVGQMSLWKTGNYVLAGMVRGTKEAIDFIHLHKVDIVLLDVSMPGENGVVLSGVLARKYPEIEMIAISGYDDYDYVREILKNGAHDYILKSRLSEELLEQSFAQIVERRTQGSQWERKKKLRSLAEQWIFLRGSNPFTQDNSRKAALAGRGYFSDQNTEEEKRVLTDGICRICEEETGDGQDVLAVFSKPDRFVIFYRFYEEISESEIQSRMERSRIVILQKAEKMFGVRMKLESCPCFFSDQALRSFLLHKLDEKTEKVENRKERLSMTLEQQKELLSVVGRRDADKAKKLVQKIYREISPEKEAVRIMVTRELLDILEKICIENEINLDFLPKDFQLFVYMQKKTKETLSDNISGLYYNALRELEDKKKIQFSDVVSAAITYMKEHLEETVTLGKTAVALSVNSSYLSRIFHVETGMTFIEYLNRIRVNRAKQLLEENVAIKEIVGRCGFRSYAYFMKIFKEYTKQTPREYLSEKKEN